MPSANALAQAVAILTEQENAESTVQVDLAISLRVCDVDQGGVKPHYVHESDEELIEVGGIWNRRTRRWEPGKSATLVVIRIPRGSEQEVAARWLAEWLSRAAIGSRGKHWDDFDRVWTLLLEGGRRGGKSFLALVALALFAVMVPNALVWAVSPTNEETDELEQALRSLLPSGWYTFRGGGNNRASQFRLPNGARILLLSGHKPRSLKRGRVDLVLYNEGQNMARAGWTQLRGAVADTGGLVIIAANPPDAEIGRWIEELHEKARAKKIKAVAFKMTAATNPFVEVKSLEDMADEVDDNTYRREVLGEFVPIGDVVFYAWSDSESIREVDPAWVDITAEVTKRELGRPFEYVIGMDFQKTPHMVAIVLKFFRDQDGDTLTVVVDEILVEDADENDLVDALQGKRLDLMPGRWTVDGRVEDEGYSPDTCAVVMDASGFTQDGEHKLDRTSEKWLKARGWRWLYYPDRESKRNPDVVERCKVTNAQLRNAAGKRRCFALRHCLRVHRAMRAWEIRNGAPYRKSGFAHVCDGVSYPIYRFFARVRGPKAKIEYRGLKRPRAGEMGTW